MKEASGRAKGGLARAAKLSKEERSQIAKNAAARRWGNLKEAVSREGIINVGGFEMQCWVLEDETRVLARASFVRAIGRRGKVKGGRKFDGEFETPVFLSAENLKPFFTKDLEQNSKPILFSNGDMQMIGYRAELLADVFDVFADAERADKLRPNQIHIAEQCRRLSRGLTRLGIIGLIDEATGYQEIRNKRALQEILAQFLSDKLGIWAKRFPDEFYEHIFRLKGWQWKGRGTNPPQVVAHYTKDIVYHRLAPGLLAELEKRNPIERGRRKNPHTRLLSDDVGIPALAQHLHTVIALQKVTPDGDWNRFMEMLDIALPRRSDTMQILKAREPKALPKPMDFLPLFETEKGPPAEANEP
jgi:hypothetical protein